MSAYARKPSVQRPSVRHTKPHAEPDTGTDAYADVESNFKPYNEPDSVSDTGPDAEPDPCADSIPDTKSDSRTNSVSDTCTNACVSTRLVPRQSRLCCVYCRTL